MAETLTTNIALSKFSQGDGPPDYTAAKHNANWDKIDLEIFNRIKKDGSVAFTGPQSMGGFKLTNLANPTASQDAATKLYVDSLQDLFAATRIVDSAGAGTDTTIQGAINSLPAAGGTIFLKGSYSISTTIVMPAKNIRIIGSGIGSTILTIVGAIPLFTTHTSFGFFKVYLSDFTVAGDNVSAQTFYAVPSLSADVLVERVDVDSVHGIVNNAVGGNAEFTFRQCHVTLAGSAGTGIYIMKGSTNGKLYWDYVELSVPISGCNLIEGFTAGSAGCNWTVLDSYTGGGGGGPSTNFYYLQSANWVNFSIDNAQFTINAAGNKVTGSHFMDASLKFKGTWNQIANCVFSGGGTGGALFDATVTFEAGFSITFQSNVTGCLFYGNGSLKGVRVDNAFDIMITGCDFYSQSTAGVALDSGTSPHASEASVVGCLFSLSSSPILEGDSNCVGYYADNMGFNPLAGDINGTTTLVDGQNVRTISTSLTLDAKHRTANVDATGASRTITLPLASTARNRIYVIKKSDVSANTVVVTRSGANTIDGATTYTLTTQYQSVRVQSDGTNWVII